jgi:NTP pyrophosphatase (non-canonical NTP hydrolase)
MEIQDYIKEMQEDSARWFDNGGRNLVILTLGLGGEAGEVLDIVKKVVRGSTTLDEVMEHLQTEIIDVFHYWCLLVGLLDIDIEAVYKRKRELNVRRFEPGTAG